MTISRMMSRTALMTGLGIAALTMTAEAAFADVACNRAGDCWHVASRHNFPISIGIQFHPESWRQRHWDKHRYHWRENHNGRGYWDHGSWHSM